MKSTRKAPTPFWTRPQLQASASLLDGSKSRIAAAALEDDAPEPPAGTTGELWLYGVVGGWWRGFDAESVANALRGLDVDVLYVRIHSPGGLASDGVAISNLLRNHRARVVVVVDGLAASAASVIATSGDEIVMCPGSQMMLHDATCMSWGNEADLLSDAAWIGGQSQNYAGVYAYKAGGTPEQWRTVMRADNGRGTWYTAEAAVAASLADRVGTIVAIGSPPVAPDDEIDWDDDEMLARAAHDLALLEHHVPSAARAAWTGQQPPKPPSAPASGIKETPTGTESAVAFSDEQMKTMRAKLGLPEDADETTIVAALDEALEERAEPAAKIDVPEGHVSIPKVKLDELTTGASAGIDAQAELHAMKREQFLDANAGKFAPANRDSWAKEYDRDPEATAEHFKDAKVIVPTAEKGHAEETETDAPTTLAEIKNNELYQSWKVK